MEEIKYNDDLQAAIHLVLDQKPDSKVKAFRALKELTDLGLEERASLFPDLIGDE